MIYATWLLVLYMPSPLSSLDAVGLDSGRARTVLHQADEVAQKHDNRHLTDGGNINGSALLDVGVEVLCGEEERSKSQFKKQSHKTRNHRPT